MNRTKKNSTALALSLALAMIMALGAAFATPAQADDPMRLVMNGTWQTAVHHYYVGQDVPGYRWDIYFRDYYNDEWRMKKVRDYGGVEYYVGNRYVPSNGKRYASSASVFHSDQGDVISFSSQNWQKEKSFSYNMIRQNDYRMYGCEYWVGMDRWDNFYMRNAWIELQSGTFGGKTRAAGDKSQAKSSDDKGLVMGVPAEVWRTADEAMLKMRLEPERYDAVMEARENEGIQ